MNRFFYSCSMVSQSRNRSIAVIFIILLINSIPVLAENYLLNGGQASEISIILEQKIEPAPGTGQLIASYIEPQSFQSPSYKQSVQNFTLDYSIRPDDVKRHTDRRGNSVIQARWNHPGQPVHIRLFIDVINRTDLDVLRTNAEFPLYALPPDVQPYLESSRQVPSDHPQVIEKARYLTKDAETEFDAVQKILAWIIDRMKYVQQPEDYSAVYSLKTGEGNCQNYSHLAATMLKAVGIPVRIVNGLTLKEPYQIQLPGGLLTMRMAQGRHSWIEVYFPDLGWVPFDPQQMQLFVSNRFIRIETGLDNDETVNDGTIRWTRMNSGSGNPKFRETLEGHFSQDQGRLFATKQPYGPRHMLFTPEVETDYSQILYEAMSSGPVLFEMENPPSVSSGTRFTLGNLNFPKNVNFFEVAGDIEDQGDGEMLLKKNFLVETAEFVTTEGRKYAQAFMLNESILLDTVSLALQKFGGDGQLWIELSDDNGAGKPGALIAGSEIKSLLAFPGMHGYQWIDFDFKKEMIILKPGRYWLALAYTGSPIVNWFFTYGKNAGPDDGTRFNTLFDATWSQCLAYEFNFRVMGQRQK